MNSFSVEKSKRLNIFGLCASLHFFKSALNAFALVNGVKVDTMICLTHTKSSGLPSSDRSLSSRAGRLEWHCAPKYMIGRQAHTFCNMLLSESECERSVSEV